MRETGHIKRLMGQMYEQLSRQRLSDIAKTSFMLDSPKNVGLLLGGREYNYRGKAILDCYEKSLPIVLCVCNSGQIIADYQITFQKLIHVLETAYAAPWATYGVPVKTNPLQLEMNFLEFIRHSGTRNVDITSPSNSQLPKSTQQSPPPEFADSTTASMYSTVFQAHPNAIVVGEVTTSPIHQSNPVLLRKLGQLERIAIFLCLHYKVKPNQLFVFLHSQQRLPLQPVDFRNQLLGVNGTLVAAFPILAQLTKDERFKIFP